MDNNKIYLNSGRNCLRYLIRKFSIKEIFIPFYTCPVVWQSVKKESCKIHFYHINSNFMPDLIFDKDSYILYTNYFGLCSDNIKELSVKYKNLIVDNAHALFMDTQYGFASFNSFRKFLNVSDGAELSINKNIDINDSFDYTESNLDYDKNDKLKYFINEQKINSEDIKFSSLASLTAFKKLNYDLEKEQRKNNYIKLDGFFHNYNELKMSLNGDIPYVYPFLNKEIDLYSLLKKNKIESEKFWNPISNLSYEGYLQKNLTGIRIDFSLSDEQLINIIKIIESL